MKLVVIAACGVAGAALMAGPIAYFRTQRTGAAHRVPETFTARPAAPSAELAPPRILVTDELVEAREVRSPAPVAPIARTSYRQRPARSRAERRSLLARLFLGAGDHRPAPFPRPGS
jgi:hypothetical protein